MPQFDNFEFGGLCSRRKRVSNGEDKVYCSWRTWTDRSAGKCLKSGNNGMVSQLFVQTRFWCRSVATFWKAKLANIKPDDSENFLEKAHLPVARFPPGWCQERNKLNDWMTANLPKACVSFGQTTKTSSRSERHDVHFVRSIFAGYTLYFLQDTLFVLLNKHLWRCENNRGSSKSRASTKTWQLCGNLFSIKMWVFHYYADSNNVQEVKLYPNGFSTRGGLRISYF